MPQLVPLLTAFVLLVASQTPGSRQQTPTRDRPAPLPPPSITASMSNAEIETGLDGWLTELVSKGDFAGVVAVARDGRVIFERGYGSAERDKGIPIAPAMRFNVGSIGKAYTKVAIARLMSEGTLKVTDPIRTHIPDYPNADTARATIEQLLGHRGGIADFFGPDFDATPKDRFRSNHDYFAYVSARPPLFSPGERNQYCNGCYIVLGEIIERIAGMPYERYIEEHVFKPAGMTGAGFLSFGDNQVAHPYTRRRGDGATPVSALGMHGRRGSAAGGSFARAADLVAFDNALRESRLLPPRFTAWYFDGVEGGSDAVSGRIGPELGIGGGAPGLNASLESGRVWTVAVTANADPPMAERVGVAIGRALR